MKGWARYMYDIDGLCSEWPPLATYLSKASRITDRRRLFPPCSISRSSMHHPFLDLDVDVVKGDPNLVYVILGLSEELSLLPTER